MTQVLFTSDLHLGHKLASEKREFASTDEHDIAVVESISRCANKRTVTWILGDVCMRIEQLVLLARIPGRLRLVRGNHDRFPTWVYRQCFEEIHGFLRYKKMWLSHCPIHPQELYGMPNIHGHLHKGTRSPELSYPYINVNWDFHRRPLSLDELKTIIEEHRHDG